MPVAKIRLFVKGAFYEKIGERALEKFKEAGNRIGLLKIPAGQISLGAGFIREIPRISLGIMPEKSYQSRFHLGGVDYNFQLSQEEQQRAFTLAFLGIKRNTREINSLRVYFEEEALKGQTLFVRNGIEPAAVNSYVEKNYDLQSNGFFSGLDNPKGILRYLPQAGIKPCYWEAIGRVENLIKFLTIPKERPIGFLKTEPVTRGVVMMMGEKSADSFLKILLCLPGVVYRQW